MFLESGNLLCSVNWMGVFGMKSRYNIPVSKGNNV